jgi:hypothetical protein
MAISFVSQITSNKFLPVSNPVNITVNSNNTGKCNFRYICDIYLDGTNVYRFKLFPDPSTGYGFFQLSDVLQDYLNDFITTTNSAGFSTATSASPNKTVAQIFCRFGEEYDSSTDCDGTINSYLNLSTSNTFYIFNGVVDYENWPTFQSGNYVHTYSTGTSSLFMTNIPRGIAEASYADNYFLEYMTLDSTTSNNKLIVVKTEWTGTTSSQIINGTSVSPGKIRLNCGPLGINKALSDSYINGSTKHYDVYVQTGATVSSEKFRIKITKPKTFRTRLGFVNRLGSLDYITFYHRNRESYNINRKMYKRYLTSNKGSGNWSYAVGDRQMTQYASTAQVQHQVSTFVDEKTSFWLNELYLSNNVFIEDRPQMIPFRVWREDQTPTSRMLFWFENDHGFLPGDSFFCIPDDNPNYVDYIDRFTIVSVDGNIIDCGLTYNIYSITETACGWIVKDETTRRIPIVITDGATEIKQKLGRPIEYILTYSNSVDKFTLRS